VLDSFLKGNKWEWKDALLLIFYSHTHQINSNYEDKKRENSKVKHFFTLHESIHRKDAKNDGRNIK